MCERFPQVAHRDRRVVQHLHRKIDARLRVIKVAVVACSRLVPTEQQQFGRLDEEVTICILERVEQRADLEPKSRNAVGQVCVQLRPASGWSVVVDVGRARRMHLARRVVGRYGTRAERKQRKALLCLGPTADIRGRGASGRRRERPMDDDSAHGPPNDPQILELEERVRELEEAQLRLEEVRARWQAVADRLWHALAYVVERYADGEAAVPAAELESKERSARTVIGPLTGAMPNSLSVSVRRRAES